MLELKLYQNNSSTSAQYGMWYPRVDYKEEYDVVKLAKHMAEHETPFSAGTIKGILMDAIKCIRHLCLEGKTVKIEDLAIFKCSVQANGLLLQQGYKVVGGLGVIPKYGPDGRSDPDFSKQAQYAIKSAKLLAQSTGDFTRAELNNDATFRWTKAAAEKINSIINPDDSEGGGTTDDTSSQGGNTQGGQTGGGNGSTIPGEGD